MTNQTQFLADLNRILKQEGACLQRATARDLHQAVGRWAQGELADTWAASKRRQANGKQACYLSAEFLVGRLVHNNLYAMGALEQVREALEGQGAAFSLLEQVEDDALGNGGLGRLAACYLDSAATLGLPLDGYGIRYRYGLFRQTIEDGHQCEQPDDWMRWGDPWGVRREDECVTVQLGSQPVLAVPYDMPVVGYGAKQVGTLRLWQAEAVQPLDFEAFNRHQYAAANHQRDEAEAISALLYPNDDTPAGKLLRLRQQYFFSSASIQDILRRYRAVHGSDFSHLPDAYAVQLNDTHPTIAIPELIRLLTSQEGLSFEQAFQLAQRVFSYTNHTVMPEAMEQWSVWMLLAVAPAVFQVVSLLNQRLMQELSAQGHSVTALQAYQIVEGGRVHMARLAVYVCHKTNGVAKIHTEILKERVFQDWYQIYPDRFCNVTNGITQRRWLGLCNPALSAWITAKLGTEQWLTKLDLLAGLRRFADDSAALDELTAIKQQNKRALCAYMEQQDGISLDASHLFDIQIKRLHEYKRQLLNALSILDLYVGIKEGRIERFTPTVFLFGGKAAASYSRAKAVIKLINEVARLVNNDPQTRGLLTVAFAPNYNVSYAERLIPAADVSEQISTAGTEASGTGNMKLSLNGAVTLGTYDGANVEIVDYAGAENNYIFGLRVEQVTALAETYNPMDWYQTHPRIKRVLDMLVDGSLDDGGEGLFQDLLDSLLVGASWHKPDQYFLLADLESYVDAKLRVNADYRDTRAFARKCLLNIAGCGYFSSDRAVAEYAQQIWNIQPYEV